MVVEVRMRSRWTSSSVAAGVAVYGLIGLEHSARLSAALVRLQDTTAQVRVRGALFSSGTPATDIRSPASLEVLTRRGT